MLNYHPQAQSIQAPPPPLLIFDQSKNPSYTLTPNRLLYKKLIPLNYKSSINKDDLSLNRIFEAGVLIFAGPRQVFSLGEFAVLKSYLDVGGSILYLIGEGGETEAGTNLNYFLEEFGMSVNSDCLVQTTYTSNLTHFHPKQAHIHSPFVNSQFKKLVEQAKSTLNNAAAEYVNKNAVHSDMDNVRSSCLFPNGSTLNVQHPSIPLLSSGTNCHPVNRPIAGIYLHPNGKGKLAVISSVEMISDQYLDKFDNAQIVFALIQYLTNPAPTHIISDAKNECTDLNDYFYVPDSQTLSSHPRICLQDTDQIPTKFTLLFNTTLYALDLSLVPVAIQAYKQLRLLQTPLTLIAPTFESPLPPLTMSTFPPLMRDLQAPSLELFDLDTFFAPQSVKLQQLTSKCHNLDLEYYLCQAGTILNIQAADSDLPCDRARLVLDHVVRKIVQWKC